jgi:hypothetical protein
LSWLLVGICALLVAMVALLALINTIVIPVATATIIAAVCARSCVAWPRHMPRTGHRDRLPHPDRRQRCGTPLIALPRLFTVIGVPV